jgi:MFS family permease
MSAMNGVFQTGGVIGTLILPWIADKWGRKWAIAVVHSAIHTRRCAVVLIENFSQSSILAIISGAVLAGSTNIAEFLVMRFIAGASAFMILAAVPVGHHSIYQWCILTFQ